MKAFLTCLCMGRLLLLLLLFNAPAVPAAGWETVYGSPWRDAALAMDVDGTDAVVMGPGHSMPRARLLGANIAVVKVDLSTTDAAWRRVLSPVSSGEEGDVCLLDNGSVAWAGAGLLPYTDRPEALAGMLSSGGDILWTRRWTGGSESEANVLLKRRAEILVIGDVKYQRQELLISRLTSSGHTMQVRKFVADNDLAPHAAAVNRRNEIIVAGSHGTNAFVARFSPNANFVNAVETEGIRLDVFDAMALFPDDDILLAGWTHSSGAATAVLVRLSRELTLRWARRYSSIVPVWGRSLDMRGALAVMAGQAGSDGFVAWLLAGSGNVLNARRYGRDRFDRINDVVMSPIPTSVYAAGFTMTDTPGAGDMWLLNARRRGDCGTPLEFRALEWRPNMKKLKLTERALHGQWRNVNVSAEKLWLQEPLCGVGSTDGTGGPSSVTEVPAEGVPSLEPDLLSGGLTMKAYPNPLEETDGLTVALQLTDSETVNIRILDMLGRTVYTWRGSLTAGEHSLRIRNQVLKTGFYLVEAATTKQTVAQQIIVR